MVFGVVKLVRRLVVFRQTPSWREASSVPSTLARILLKARSRAVEVSSAKGAKPQSSVVPSCRMGRMDAASRM